jgi:hypothetical protein
MNGDEFAGGYTVTATVLGDTFTRNNLVAQLWHGAVGVGGRLIATLSIPRLAGSVTEQRSYQVSAYWDTTNTHLHGQPQELHAVLLHSGFEATSANIIAHVSRKVSVACFGEIDLCGVCGGFGRSCAGCDGVAHSGLVLDACGRCGGDGSSCCVPRPQNAKLHRVRLLRDDSDAEQEQQQIRRVKAGELVVWENMLDWEVEIVSGGLNFSDNTLAAFELSALRDHGNSIPVTRPTIANLETFTQVPLTTLGGVKACLTQQRERVVWCTTYTELRVDAVDEGYRGQCTERRQGAQARLHIPIPPPIGR